MINKHKEIAYLMHFILSRELHSNHQMEESKEDKISTVISSIKEQLQSRIQGRIMITVVVTLLGCLDWVIINY